MPIKSMHARMNQHFIQKILHHRAAISDAAARSSIVLCNSVCADRIVMAASRLLGVAAAGVILLPFAAGYRESYWNGCIKAVICHEIFSNSALVIFLLEFLVKRCFKTVFFCFGVEIRFWSCNF